MALNPALPIVAPNDLITSAQMNNVRANIDRVDNRFANVLSLNGGTMLGALVLSGPPGVGLAAATKTYVDTSTGAAVPLTGGAMSGNLDVGGDPTTGVAGVRLAPSGTIYTLRSAPSINLQLYKAGAAYANGQHYVAFYGQTSATVNGTITQGTGTTVAYVASSDRRLKDVVGPVADPLDVIAALRPVAFTWKADGAADVGFIADEVQTVVPNAVFGEPDAVTADGDIDPQQLNATALIPYLVAAVQALSAQVADLTSRLDDLL